MGGGVTGTGDRAGKLKAPTLIAIGKEVLPRLSLDWFPEEQRQLFQEKLF